MFVSRIGNRELGTLCERVGIAFDVGHDPHRIFDRESVNGRGRHRGHMKSVATSVRSGTTLAEAIRAQGNYFPDHFSRLVEIGEETGRLEVVLERMADYYKDLADRTDEFRGAIIWPVIQLVLGLIVVSVLIYVPSVVAPDEAEAADMLGIGLSGGRGLAIFWGIVLAVVAAGTTIAVLLRNGRLRFLGHLFAGTPVLGRALRAFDEATFVQSLALAVESGVDAWHAIGLSFRSAASPLFAARAQAAQDAIRQGRDMHVVLEEAGLFSRATIEAVQLGEESGRLAETLDKHAQYLRMQVRFAMAAITQLASSLVWIAVAALLILVIFRVFGRYLGTISPDGVARLLDRGRAP
jgi:type II secretory pathway component PulF